MCLSKRVTKATESNTPIPTAKKYIMLNKILIMKNSKYLKYKFKLVKKIINFFFNLN